MSEFNGCTSVKDLWIEQNLRNLEHQQGVAPVAVFPGAIVPAGRRVVMVQNLDGTQVIDVAFASNFPEYALGVSVKPREMAQNDEDYFLQCARGM